MLRMISDGHVLNLGLDDGARSSLFQHLRHGALHLEFESRTFYAELRKMAVHALSKHLIADVVSLLGDFASLHSCPILSISQLAYVDAPGPTPTSGFADDSALRQIDAYLLGMLGLLGAEAVAFPFENGGRLARNVVVNPAYQGIESSWGADISLGWHQDNNFQPFSFDEDAETNASIMPRYLIFLGIRNAECVPTQLLTLQQILSRLDAESIAALQQDDFLVAPPPSVARSGNVDAAALTKALLREYKGHLYGRIDLTDGVSAVTRSGERALKQVREVVKTVEPERISITVAPGDCLVFDNYRVVHRREKFAPGPPHESRWLRRMYGARIPQRGSDLLG